MQTVDASVILEDAERRIGWDIAQLEDRQKQMARQAFSMALEEVWNAWWWEELMRSERVQFAPSWVSGWNYSPGIVVYSPISDWYYVALNPGPTNPVIQIGDLISDGAGGYIPSPTQTDNLAGWARWNELDNPQTWQSSLNPALGDHVTWNGQIYQWIVPQGALANYEPSLTIPASNVAWYPVLTSFQPVAPYIGEVPNFSPPGGYTATPTGPFGRIREVSAMDPREGPGRSYRFLQTSDGTQIFGLDTGRPWIWYRRPTPIITGDDFDTTAEYTATEPSSIAFN